MEAWAPVCPSPRPLWGQPHEAVTEGPGSPLSVETGAWCDMHTGVQVGSNHFLATAPVDANLWLSVSQRCSLLGA